MSIFNKLVIVFLAFIIIPMAFVSYMVFYNAKDGIEKETLSELNIIADMQAHELETFFSEKIADTLVLGRRYIYKITFSALDRFSQDRSNPSYIEAKKIVDSQLVLFERAHKYIDIVLVNTEGRIIYASNPEHEFEMGTVIPDKDDAFRKIETGICIGDISKTTHKEHPYTLYLMGPVYGEADKVIGLVRMEIDTHSIYEALQSDNATIKSWEALFVKKMPDNRIMFVSPLKYEPGVILTKIINIGDKYGLPAQKAASGESGSGLSIDYGGREVLSAWRSIKSLGWGFVVKINSEEAFLPIKKLKGLWGIVIFITIFSAMFTAFAVARSISDPIRELHRGAEVVGLGNLDYKIGLDIKDETGQLSRAFDTMTAKLKASTTSIGNLNREIIQRKTAEEQVLKVLKKETISREVITSMLADNNEIRKKLEEHIVELKRAQNMIIQSEKLASLGTLVSEIAHEFNNPLMIISGNAQLSMASEPLSIEVKNSLQIIVEECQNAKKLIQGLLKFSKPSKGNIENVDINKSLEAMASLLEPQFNPSGIEIKREYGDSLAPVPLDRELMREVFINLMNNAKDAMPEGGTITIKTFEEGDYLGIDFKDTGSGMSEETKKRLLEPFFTTKEKGTGLGLSICYGIIRAHGGELRFEGRLGAGTTATVLLPLGGV